MFSAIKLISTLSSIAFIALIVFDTYTFASAEITIISSFVISKSGVSFNENIYPHLLPSADN